MLSVPVALAILFPIAYVLSNFVFCPMLLEAEPLCGGTYDIGMLLITFFSFFTVAFFIFLFVVIKRFSSPSNLKNLPQYVEANQKISDMVQNAEEK